MNLSESRGGEFELHVLLCVCFSVCVYQLSTLLMGWRSVVWWRRWVGGDDDDRIVVLVVVEKVEEIVEEVVMI